MAEHYDKNYVEDIFQKSSLFQALKPLLWNLKLCGLYHKRQWRVKNGQGDLEEIRKVTPSRMWSIFLIIIHWLNTGKSLMAFQRGNEFGPDVLMKILTSMWHIYCTILCMIMYRCWAKPDHLPGFIYKWETLCKQDTEGTLRKFKHLIKIGLIFTWVTIIGNFVCITLFVLQTDILDATFIPFDMDDNSLFVGKLVTIVMSGTVVNATCMFSSLFHIAVTWLLNEEFKKFNKQFKDNISECHGLKGSIESHRKRHMDICQLAGFADEAFRLYHLLITVVPITACLITAYNAMYLDEIHNDSFLLISMIFMIFLNLYFIIEALLMCAIVNNTAHDIYNDVHSLDLGELDQKEILQVSVFLNKLAGHPEQIGLKVACFYVIDSPTILAVFGVLLSYFFMLFSFKPASPESMLPAALRNCTTV
ncbi:unnamed protein product [Owenia fusiformis]|uniref:Uncharacterized protein n=1 Tax=Owenia fusiformis TaxID=6347 RepID=A0A8J1TZ77_OWEFU|nr:unnamed protein product [Owenia fusiformis]